MSTANPTAQTSNQANTPAAPGLSQPKQDLTEKNQALSVKNAQIQRDEAKKQNREQGIPEPKR